MKKRVQKIGLAAAFLLGIASGLFAQVPQRTDVYWDPNAIGSAGPVQYGATVAAVSSSGAIYIAGNYQLGNATPIRVARWSGGQWQVLGDRLFMDGFSQSGFVNAIAVDASGNVYVGGTFDRALNSDGTLVQSANIIMWSAATSRWAPLGGGVSDDVLSIAIDGGGNVYVSGNLTRSINPDGSQVNTFRIAKWRRSGSEWEPLGDGLSTISGGEIQKIGMDSNGRLIVTGRFPNVYNGPQQPVAVNNAASWGGTSWSALAGGLTTATASTISIARVVGDNTGRTYVFGEFGEAVNSDGTRVAGPLVYWDGSRWNGIGLPATATLHRDLAVNFQGAVYALYTSPGFSSTVLDRWDGSAWRRLATRNGFPSPATVAANPAYGADFLYMGGGFNEFEDETTSMTAKISGNALWQGTQWQAMRQNSGIGATGEVLAMSVDGTRTAQYLYIGGSLTSVDGVSANNVARFDGTNWDPMGAGVVGTVRAIETVTWPWSGAFVGGSITEAINPDGSRVAVQNLAYWDNTTGQWFNVGSFDGAVNALSLAFAPRRLIAGGEFDSVTTGGTRFEANNLAQFDFFAQAWEPLGDGVTGQSGAAVNTIATWIFGSYFTRYFQRIAVGGRFDTATNTDGSTFPANNIAVWDGGNRTWFTLGGGVDDEVLALNRIGRSVAFPLWVGGRFQNATNRNGTVESTRHIARWDGVRWNSLGGGVDGPVHAIGLTGLYSHAIIGGAFTNAIDPDGSQVVANNVALFDFRRNVSPGPGWVAFGSGTNGTVRSLQNLLPCGRPAELFYAGGSFTIAGQRRSGGLGKWKFPFAPQYRSVSYVSRSSSTGRRTGRGTRGIVATLSLPACSPLAKTVVRDEVLLATDLAFGESQEAPNLPVLEPFDLVVVDSNNPADTLFTVDSLIVRSENPQLFALVGVDDSTSFAPNPDGLRTQETIVVCDVALDALADDAAGVMFVHGITDAGAVAVLSASGDTVAAGLRFGAASGPHAVSPGQHVFDVVAMNGSGTLTSISVDVTGKPQTVATAVLQGFVDPAANEDGPPVGVQIVEIAPATMTAVTGPGPGTPPDRFALHQSYPNPFNPQTTISYTLVEPTDIELAVYDQLGRRVADLVRGTMSAGAHEVLFDAASLASGVYFARLSGNGVVLVQKMVLLR